MLRLAIVISHPIQYHAPLYTHLAKDGRFQIKVFYMSDRGSRPFYEEWSKTVVKYDNPILDGYEYVFLKPGEPKTWWQKRTEFISFDLEEQLLEYAPQAVYFHGYNNLCFLKAMTACRKAGIPVLLRGENEDLLPRPLWRTSLRKLLLTVLLPQIDGFLYIGEYNKQFFLDRGISAKKLFYVPYSVDNNYFRAGLTQAEVDAIRRKIVCKYSLQEESRLFIYTHKLRDTMKPLDAVSAFCNMSRSERHNAVLFMCGDGDLRSQAESLAAECAGAKVIFTGYLSQADLKEHMLASDVMINPAIEPWGCSVSEGLACGLAMISSDMVVGWPDMVLPGKNGYVYPCGDLQELSNLINKFCSMPADNLSQMKMESLKLSEKLSFATCADGLEEAMQNVHSGVMRK
jgi:glycosyltransferase involved in cell wall biosynthesis